MKWSDCVIVNGFAADLEPPDTLRRRILSRHQDISPTTELMSRDLSAALLGNCVAVPGGPLVTTVAYRGLVSTQMLAASHLVEGPRTWLQQRCEERILIIRRPLPVLGIEDRFHWSRWWSRIYDPPPRNP